MVEREPGHGAIGCPHAKAVSPDGDEIGHQGLLGHRDTQRKTRAAGGKLQITEAVRVGRGQRVAARGGQVGEGSSQRQPQAFARLGEPFAQGRRS